MPKSITLTTRILRKQDDLPRYVVIEPELVAGQEGAFPAKVSINGCKPFDRNIRPWGKGSEVYFFNLTEQQCKAADIDAGDRCEIEIVLED